MFFWRIFQITEEITAGIFDTNITMPALNPTEMNVYEFLHWEHNYSNNRIRQQALKTTPLGRQFAQIPFVPTVDHKKPVLGDWIGWYDDSQFIGGQVIECHSSTCSINPIQNFQEKKINILRSTKMTIDYSKIVILTKKAKHLLLRHNYSANDHLITKKSELPIWDQVYQI